MKSSVIIVFCIAINFCSIRGVVAQKFSGEPYIGLNISRKSDVSLVKSYNVNFHYGLMGSYEFKPNFKLNLGVGLSNRRQEYKSLDTLDVLSNSFSFLGSLGVDFNEIEETLNQNGIVLEEYEETYGIAKLTHLEIPLSISYQLKSYQFDVGGYVGFLVNSSKNQLVTSRIPALEAIELDSLDSSGFISSFLPPANSEKNELLNNSEGLDSFIYGIRLGLSYNYKSFVKFYGNYNLDLNKYSIDNNNLLINSRSFFRFGIAYIIKKVEVNEDQLKGRFE